MVDKYETARAGLLSDKHIWLAGIAHRLMLRDRPQIDAKRSVPQELKPKSKKIFVGGLAPDTNDGTCSTSPGLYALCLP